MKRGITGVLIGVFLLAALVMLTAFNLTKSRVLVLHSMARDNGWAQRVDDGIRKVLEKNRRPVSVHWHYLGMENLESEQDRLDAAKVARRAIAQFRPDVVLAVDDESHAYVARHYAAPPGVKAPDTHIVYAAIDRDPNEYGYGTAANLTGILERLPLRAVQEALPMVQSGKPARIAAIAPSDETGIAQMKQVQAFDWGPHRIVSAQNLPDFVSWQDAIRKLEGKADILLVLTFVGLPAGGASSKPAKATDIARWIETQAKPLPIGIGTSYVENGGGFAIAPSPREMGEVGMQKSLEWLRNIANGHPEPPPPVVNAHYRVAVRESALRARGLVLPSVYLETARLDRSYFP